MANDQILNKSVFILLTGLCNKSCYFCFNGNVGKNLLDDKINSNNLPELLDNLAAAGIADLIVTGGEPLMNLDMLELAIRRSKKLGMAVSVDSNGTLLNVSTIDRLASSGLDYLYLSSYFLKTISEDILAYARMNLNVRVIHVLTKNNVASLGDFVDFLKRNGFGFPVINPVFMYENHANFSSQSLASLLPDDLKNAIEIIKGVYKQNDLQFPRLLEDFYMERRAGFPTFCHMGESDLVIYSNGDVFPCFHRRDLFAGNVFRDSLEVILEKNRSFSFQLSGAACFGEYCLSHFTN